MTLMCFTAHIFSFFFSWKKGLDFLGPRTVVRLLEQAWEAVHNPDPINLSGRANVLFQKATCTLNNLKSPALAGHWDRSFFWIVHLWFNFLTPTCPSRLGSLPLLCFFCGVFLTTWFCAGFFPTWTPWSPSPVPASWPTAFSSRLCLHLSACALSTEEGKALQLFVETC